MSAPNRLSLTPGTYALWEIMSRENSAIFEFTTPDLAYNELYAKGFIDVVSFDNTTGTATVYLNRRAQMARH
jgi:hypothetical protein